MQASRFTAMAVWLVSGAQVSRAGKRLSVTPMSEAQFQNLLSGSCDVARSGWSATSSSKTMPRAFSARSLALFTTMPSRGSRMQEAASTRSPSISTMQARQLPSAR